MANTVANTVANTGNGEILVLPATTSNYLQLPATTCNTNTCTDLLMLLTRHVMQIRNANYMYWVLSSLFPLCFLFFFSSRPLSVLFLSSSSCPSSASLLGTEVDYQHEEEWLVMHRLATGDTRDVSLSEEMEVLRRGEDPSTSLAPVVGLACRLKGGRKGEEVVGRFCSGSAVGAVCG